MHEPGDVLLARGVSPWERLIEYATSSPYSHAAMLTPTGDLLVEAKDFAGVRTVPVDTYPNADWFRVKCSPQKRLRAAGWALSRVGQSYGWNEVLHDWNRPLVGLEIARRTELRKVDCSGLVVYAYGKAGVTLTRRPFPTPADLSWSVALEPLNATREPDPRSLACRRG